MSKRIHFRIFSELESEDFSSEKSEVQGDITVVMLTRDSGFAAEKDQFINGRIF